MSLIFKQLTNRDFIGTCQALLPNKMQCYKGSVYSVTDDSTDPLRVTQYCLGHARIEEAKARGSYTEPTHSETEFTVETTPVPTEVKTEQKEKKPEEIKNVNDIKSAATKSV